MKTFTKEELEALIKDKDLKISLIANVSTKQMGDYLMVVQSEETLESELQLYGVSLIDTEYMLLSDEEISYIQKTGRLV